MLNNPISDSAAAPIICATPWSTRKDGRWVAMKAT